MTEEERQTREAKIAAELEADEARKRREKIAALRAAAGIPVLFEAASLDDLDGTPATYQRMAKRLAALMEFPATVAMVGPRGVGKTHLGAGLCNLAASMGRSALYCRAMDLFLKLRRSYGRDGPSEATTLDHCSRVSLLVLDEVQVRHDTPWELAVLTSILDGRHANMRPTLMISNLSAPAFMEAVGDSIASRLTERGAVLQCTWQSFRDAKAGSWLRQVEGADEDH